MTTEELMKLADAYAGRFGAYRLSRTGLALSEYQQAREELEAALSAKQGEQEPVDKVAAMQRIVDSNTGYVRHPATEAKQEPVADDIGVQQDKRVFARIESMKKRAHPVPAAKQEQNKCAQCNKEYSKGAGVGCPKCAKGVDIAESEFRKPLPAPEAAQESEIVLSRESFLMTGQRIAELEDELHEQARVNGMGSEREATLMAKVERKDAALRVALEALESEDCINVLMQDAIDLIKRELSITSSILGDTK